MTYQKKEGLAWAALILIIGFAFIGVICKKNAEERALECEDCG